MDDRHRDLREATLTYTKVRTDSDDRHTRRCEFCGEALTYGYATTDDEHDPGADAVWVCGPCFDALRDSYGWRNAPRTTRADKIDAVVDWVGAKVLRWIFWHVPPH